MYSRVAAGRVAAIQTLSGTGACRAAGVFLERFSGADTVYVSDPTWGNHIAIFEKAVSRPHKTMQPDSPSSKSDTSYVARTARRTAAARVQRLERAPRVLLARAAAFRRAVCAT